LTEAIVYLNAIHDYKIKLYLLARNIEAFRVSVPHLAKHKFIYLINQDVRTVSDLPNDINYVIHAAASPDSREHNTQPLKTVDTIVKGTSNILEACWRLQDLRKFINISSNNIYGHVASNEQGIAENEMGYLDCNSIGSIYAESKRTAEAICAAFKNQQRLPIITVRPFTFIGPYQSLEKPWAANSFMRDALLGGPIRILGDENTVRSYLYGSDMAIWLLKILAVGKVNAVYNIGGIEAISLKDLAKKIAEQFSTKIEIQVKSSKDFSSSNRFNTPNLESLKKDCNVVQQIGLIEAIKKTIAANKFKENIYFESF
jgi:dTDP-glucose 4,6-dehydratase